jgi:hypothetical protein
VSLERATFGALRIGAALTYASRSKMILQAAAHRAEVFPWVMIVQPFDFAEGRYGEGRSCNLIFVHQYSSKKTN